MPSRIRTTRVARTMIANQVHAKTPAVTRFGAGFAAMILPLKCVASALAGFVSVNIIKRNCFCAIAAMTNIIPFAWIHRWRRCLRRNGTVPTALRQKKNEPCAPGVKGGALAPVVRRRAKRPKLQQRKHQRAVPALTAARNLLAEVQRHRVVSQDPKTSLAPSRDVLHPSLALVRNRRLPRLPRNVSAKIVLSLGDDPNHENRQDDPWEDLPRRGDL